MVMVEKEDEEDEEDTVVQTEFRVCEGWWVVVARLSASPTYTHRNHDYIQSTCCLCVVSVTTPQSVTTVSHHS